MTGQHYDELVKLGRHRVAQMSSVQWRLGDAAGEIDPMRAPGGVNPPGSEELFTVSEALRMFAEDVGLACTTVRNYRWVASRWPEEHRRADVSHTIHKLLASIPDEEERFEAVASPPAHPRGGPTRWTHDSAKRIVGWKVDTPRASRKKWTPSMTWQRTTRSAAFVQDAAGPLPQLARMEHNAQFMDLVVACTQFVVTAGRIVPKLRGTPFDDPERETVLHGLSRVRASADWIENASPAARSASTSGSQSC
ncbi:DUF6192 family protein [Streptomyces sp. NRRL F-5650]|uniref:DUF6192 family protein n=1 Tax=Streptomyces sp. NRRL F-5650 TaxID=1463868 RepID=UPI001F174539|nr:DUF6192 family protein [Streptomyces sp. NRRL F-5650]